MAATLLGAFLVFQVQPVISKTVLPWFGGSPAVWTTCMLFFQLLLFGGYLYAHLLVQHVPRRLQGIVHAGLLIAAVLSLPIQPAESWKPRGEVMPVPYLLMLLTVHVGLPYFVLASTGPLVQAWLARRQRDPGVYRLYAYSNIGSLTALVSYPILVEPLLPVGGQSLLWSLLFCGFALVQGLLALWFAGAAAGVDSAGTQHKPQTTAPAVRPSRYRRVCWLLLPALASVGLLAVTNHLCQDVAVIPFLWVLPLSLYLLSFIICFDRPRWYRPRPWAALLLACVAGLIVLAATPLSHWIVLDAALHVTALMALCMLCHGEVSRLKPSPSRLTQYYLMLSAGGALGGLSVGLLCPLVLTSYAERSICLALAAAVATAICIGYRPRRTRLADYDLRRVRAMRGGLLAMVLIVLYAASDAGPAGVAASSRNFFGVLRVVQMDDCVAMMHGRTMHGLQVSAAPSQPTTYYGRESGIGRVLMACGRSSHDNGEGLRVAGVGLGCGTLASYGRPGDRFDFIEINPDVIRMSKDHFSFLADSQAEINLLLGDGRLLLEEQAEASYDVIALDAFSSDSVPAHLLTREAFALYRSRLGDRGVLVVHVTNRHLNLPPVVHRLAADAGWSSALVSSQGDMDQHTLAAQWMVIAKADHPLWSSPELEPWPTAPAPQRRQGPLWTDDYHDLLSIVRLRSR
ncbi:spermidine synthase [Roseimaritima sediminicola]|uniref:spermidine synthase n=1 Tax=Roseimaritima sediminicola TaxID=2662066 RepID=UPI0012982BB8|nr:fused MFS/spermidine synthase [Roseimaritima sediminicola]